MIITLPIFAKKYTHYNFNMTEYFLRVSCIKGANLLLAKPTRVSAPSQLDKW